MRLLLSEHEALEVYKNEGVYQTVSKHSIRVLRTERGYDILPYKMQSKEETLSFTADYYIGVDWLVEDKKYIQVEPKLNSKIVNAFIEVVDKEEEQTWQGQSIVVEKTDLKEVDYLKMLLTVYSGLIQEEHLKHIVYIDWETKQIPINQHQDLLTPFLIVQYLQLLKKIVRKGLKKSYYKVEEDLKGRVKGKILVGKQLKQNIFKNKLLSTKCEYEMFGEDGCENRFLKKVFRFVCSYVENNKSLFKGNEQQLEGLINYCRPPFDQIGNKIEIHQLKQIKVNSFFREYGETIKIGKHILKRFSYNISKTAEENILTPPFWIDMPRLFELYVYHYLLKSNQERKDLIKYQFSTHGNALDILICNDKDSIVIDTKYKLHYRYNAIHEDIRQVSGYARLKKVRREIGLDENDNSTIDCLIIYPNSDGIELCNEELKLETLINQEQNIKPYYKVYKLGVKLPYSLCLCPQF